MTFDDFQREAKRTHDAPFPDRERLPVMTLGLCGEAGEVAELVKKAAWHGQTLDLEKISNELGDVLWYVADLATSLGLSLEAIAAGNVEKLRRRYPNGFTADGGLR